MKVALAVLLVVLLAWKASAKWCFNPADQANPFECTDADTKHCTYTAEGTNGVKPGCDKDAAGPSPLAETDVATKCVKDGPAATFGGPYLIAASDTKDPVVGTAVTAGDFKIIKDCAEMRKGPPTLLASTAKFCFDPKAVTVAKQCTTAGTDNCKYTGKTDDPATQMLECVASGPTGIEDCKDKTIVVTAAGAPTAAEALAATGSSKKLFEDCEMKAKIPAAGPMPTTTPPPSPGDGGVSSVKSSVLLLFVTSVLGAVAKSFL